MDVTGVRESPVASKAALDPNHDAAAIQQLALLAIAQRRRLLALGNDLRIRLHYGASMSCVDILTLLYQRWLRIDPRQPDWEGRDRFILSKGHAAPALYVALAQRGFFADTEFDQFRTLGNILQGHPDRNKTPGVDCTTGSLGQGFPVGCGMALGAKIDDAPFRVYALISDGECNEGSVWEAALIAANLNLDRLTLLVDWNQKSSYGPMEGRNAVAPLADKWRAFGWRTIECDGHDFVSLSNALAEAERVRNAPSVLLCHTIKGKGIPWVEANNARSNFALTAAQYEEAIAHLDTLESNLSTSMEGK